jgi:hypothetical protein
VPTITSLTEAFEHEMQCLYRCYSLTTSPVLEAWDAPEPHLLKKVTMKKLILLATIAFALVAGTMMVHTQSAVACATWHCGCQEHPGAAACRE